MTEAYQRFLDSMNINYMKWHDGVGYDLHALRELLPDERKEVEDILIARGSQDWRDIEALAELSSEIVLVAIENALKNPNYEVRAAAIEILAKRGYIDADKIEAALVEMLPSVTILNGQTVTLRLAEKYSTPTVRRTLLWCSLYGNNKIRGHAAALIYYLYGIAASSFDWNYRPLFLRFGDKDFENRKMAYFELCENIHVDPQWAMDQTG